MSILGWIAGFPLVVLGVVIQVLGKVLSFFFPISLIVSFYLCCTQGEVGKYFFLGTIVLPITMIYFGELIKIKGEWFMSCYN